MHLILDLTSPEPLYLQIRDRLVEAIADGRLQPGDQLPSARRLAAEFAVNLHTVLKAYALLEVEGLVHMGRGQRAIVLPRPADDDFRQNWEKRLVTLLAEARARRVPRAEIERTVRTVLDGLNAAPGRVPEGGVSS
ncbi:MAG: GntR family transcriptional regulator [Firmicutes bacterium]|nr:GntR family transcriptional regulator [Bacillota bacterium]